MNGILLDTHAWVWFGEGRKDRLSDETIILITRAAKHQSVFVSVISIWELGLLEAKAGIRLSSPVHTWVDRFFEITNFRLTGLDRDIALDSCFLPGDIHSDPADRFLVATARNQDLILLTRDNKILDYGQKGHVKTRKI